MRRPKKQTFATVKHLLKFKLNVLQAEYLGNTIPTPYIL